MTINDVFNRKLLKDYISEQTAPRQHEALLSLLKLFPIGEQFSGSEVRRIIRLNSNQYVLKSKP